MTGKQEALARLREVHVQIDAVVAFLDQKGLDLTASDLGETRQDLKRVRDWIESQP